MDYINFSLLVEISFITQQTPDNSVPPNKKNIKPKPIVIFNNKHNIINHHNIFKYLFL